MSPTAQQPNAELPQLGGILLVNKPKGKTSFHLVARLRRLCGERRIGHAGTLDPLATGVMVLLIGRDYTRLSDSFLGQDKEYIAEIHLGISTATFDSEGEVTGTHSHIPPLNAVEEALADFQGTVLQTPPMFSAKKVGGKKLYELARKGISIERQPAKVTMQITLLEYHYPHLKIRVRCSKGTYIRSLAHDIGLKLGCGAHLSALQRTRSGTYTLQECIDGHLLDSATFNPIPFFRT
jgi:tRNA pseudouridine55 synthase